MPPKIAPAPGYSAQQAAVNDMMRRALEEDQYSALGSVVDTDSSDDEEEGMIDGVGLAVARWNRRPRRSSSQEACDETASTAPTRPTPPPRLDRNALASAVRRHLRLEGARSVRNFDCGSFREDAEGFLRRGGGTDAYDGPVSGTGADALSGRGGKGRGKKRGKTSSGDPFALEGDADALDEDGWEDNAVESSGAEEDELVGDVEEESSIFGQTAGASNATWVECDRCKKWRRLRGVVDARKLPSRWYCSMNRNDPERARCSAPEEEYDAGPGPESDADRRARRHLRVWVRRLHCNEAYEGRQRGGKKRAALAALSGATGLREPYDWIRCCNPSCGKWRMLLRSMDVSSVIDKCKDGEWYCVMNTWDEKAASCGAAQENLPAVGCPPWVMVDNKE
ncbi:hypothetical protein ACHAWF_004115 [Thalassiosira exigua]